MNIGVVSWTLGTAVPEEVIAKVKSLGLSHVQYAGDHRDGSGEHLRELARAADVGIIAIDPFNAGPADPSTATEAAAIAYYREVVDFAAQAGGIPVTLQGLSQWTRNCTDRPSAMQRLLNCCKAVDAYACKCGVPTLYEVCNHYEVPLIHTAAQCRELLDRMESDNVRMILDSFHMNLNEPDPLETLKRNASFTAIYHISDSGRGGIGSGHIDFQAHHEALIAGGFTGDVAIELVLPHLTPSNAPTLEEDRRRLDADIRQSAMHWQGFS